MADYSELKLRLLLTTAALVAGGSLVCWIHGASPAPALPAPPRFPQGDVGVGGDDTEELLSPYHRSFRVKA